MEAPVLSGYAVPMRITLFAVAYARGRRGRRHVTPSFVWMTRFAVAVAFVVLAGAATSACTIGSAAARELSRCRSVDGAYEAVLVEPPGQWQDQFVHVAVNDRNGVKVVGGEIGFAAGSVDGLAWATDGRLALTSGADATPRVWVDVAKRDVGQQLPYGEAPPPAATWAKTCRGP